MNVHTIAYNYALKSSIAKKKCNEFEEDSFFLRKETIENIQSLGYSRVDAANIFYKFVQREENKINDTRQVKRNLLVRFLLGVD